jgi:hypothetical protein
MVPDCAFHQHSFVRVIVWKLQSFCFFLNINDGTAFVFLAVVVYGGGNLLFEEAKGLFGNLFLGKVI